ncbi:hypothetical protein GNP63_12005 [Aliivibrio fischeri]|uniref:Uncharacterized protein n=1 Tax=Aliivibrio fischeri (strain MJ11) TaxID=388396 RepID=B5EUJ3_ALIFM|nr:hypothetical protein [Aliivibrio fischeri]ACH64195.1 conserved hypothetical protein [Aliivibrio fischeri MJ11]MUH97259.1 hypothetical protein [Aliivibrio fischeri]MUI64923.1 hypothetical protein [Aliivibrio fischeri]
MNSQYNIFSKTKLEYFPFQQTPKPIVPVEPDLLLEMTFSPKLFIINDIAEKVENLVQHGVEWLDARIDCSPSQPSDEQIKVFENFRMPYIHQTYRLTNEEKQYGKLNWLDLNSVDLDFSRLNNIPLEERLIFKLEEDFGYVFIHESVIELLKKHVKDVWVRDV